MLLDWSKEAGWAVTWAGEAEWAVTRAGEAEDNPYPGFSLTQSQ